MGWWTTNETGHSFTHSEPEMLWGDSVADILDDAISHIVAEFKESIGRDPTLAELQAGFKFATNVYEDDNG